MIAIIILSSMYLVDRHTKKQQLLLKKRGESDQAILFELADYNEVQDNLI